jgi:hypothetical protein
MMSCVTTFIVGIYCIVHLWAHIHNIHTSWHALLARMCMHVVKCNVPWTMDYEWLA